MNYLYLPNSASTEVASNFLTRTLLSLLYASIFFSALASWFSKLAVDSFMSFVITALTTGCGTL